MQIAIVEDNQIDAAQTLKHIQTYQNIHNLNLTVESFQSGLHLMKQFEPKYDLYFLDVEMEHMNGIEVANFIRKYDRDALIIFVTNNPNYAIKGYDVNAYDYIIKPFEYTTFSLKFDRILDLQNIINTSLYIKDESTGRQVSTNDILYVEINDHWLCIVDINGEFEMLGSLKEMEDKLYEYNFVRCNKSVLINLKHVMKLTNSEVELTNGMIFQIARSRKKAVQESFIHYYQV